ncbi:MAG: outer membrane lipoprotein-sorting protein [Spirochaetota bacterium]
MARFGEVEKKLLFFTAPADVRDTAFMNRTYDDPSRPDDQWIYLPALRRARRISAEKKNDNFMGSDPRTKISANATPSSIRIA